MVAELTEDLCRGLAQIRLAAYVSGKAARRVYEEVYAALEKAGLHPEIRAEGHAFFLTPTHEALALPHIRLTAQVAAVAVWVRSPYALTEERARAAGLTTQEAYQKLLNAAKAAAQAMQKATRREQLQISLPAD